MNDKQTTDILKMIQVLRGFDVVAERCNIEYKYRERPFPAQCTTRLFVQVTLLNTTPGDKDRIIYKNEVWVSQVSV
jgi:hypothetical protein